MDNKDYNVQRRNVVTCAIFDEQNALIDKFQILKTLSKADIESGTYPNLSEGQQIKINPDIPNDPKEAFQLFKNYYGAFQSLTHKSIFFDRYKSFDNENAINAEIEIFKKFISKAKEISYTDACNHHHHIDDFSEYKRLVDGFYNDYLMTWTQHNLNSTAASVYGRYFLFFDYLKSRLVSINKAKKRTLKKLEYYFSEENEFAGNHISAYNHFFIKNDISNQITPLDFFKTVERELNFFEDKADNYLVIVKHFDKFSKEEKNLHILFYLKELLEIKLKPYEGRGLGSRSWTFVPSVITKASYKYICETYLEIERKLNSKETEEIETKEKEFNQLRSISEIFTLEYYLNKENIGNQELVKMVFDYFDKGQGSRVFKPLDFLNLLKKQFDFVTANIGNESLVISTLSSLPLSDLNKHILYGFILKWFGGYPIIEVSDFDDNNRATKKAIERLFLSYPGETPEKDFCKADKDVRGKMNMWGKALTLQLRHGIDPVKTLEALGYDTIKPKAYYSFDELFKDVYQEGLIDGIENKEQFFISLTKHLFDFENWLEDTQNWIDRDEDQFSTFLKKDIFFEFLDYQKGEQLSESAVSSNLSEKVNHSKIDEPQNQFIFEKEISEIKSLENQFWKGVPMVKVVNHFFVLTTKKSSNGQPYLTQHQLILF